MISADDGCLSVNSAKQNVRQVKTVLSKISNSGKSDMKLLWNKSLLSKFLQLYPKEKQHMPGTIKSYQFSIKHLYKICLEDEVTKLTNDDK